MFISKIWNLLPNPRVKKASTKALAILIVILAAFDRGRFSKILVLQNIMYKAGSIDMDTLAQGGSATPADPIRFRPIHNVKEYRTIIAKNLSIYFNVLIIISLRTQK